MSDRQDWNRSLFETLSSNKLSRNKQFASFANEWFKSVHRRYRVVSSLKKDAQRLGDIPESNCWISEEGDGLMFHLQSPRLSYKRAVVLHPYEWDWLVQQEEIQVLLSTTTGNALLAQ